jgi:hypothetical protein
MNKNSVSILPAIVAAACAFFHAGCGGGVTRSAAPGNGGGDTSAPAVESVAPAAGSTGVPISASVVLTFSEPVDELSAEAAFGLYGGSGAVSGSFGPWSGKRMTFTPSSALLDGTVYLITVGAGTRDLNGNPMTSPFTASFTTETVNDPYFPDFTAVPGGTPADYGFAGDGVSANDHFAVTPQGHISTEPSPGGWSSSMFSPDLGRKDRTLDGGLAIEWRINYPAPNNGSVTNYMENNKFYLSLVGENDVKEYQLMFKPHISAAAAHVPDLELKKYGLNPATGAWELASPSLALVNTGTIVPHNQTDAGGNPAGWVTFRMELASAYIRVLMDGDDRDGVTLAERMNVPDASFTSFRKLHFQYKTDTNQTLNYWIYLDGVSVAPLQ